jgi:flagellar hook protein FlgE
MLRSLSSAISGLEAEQTAMDVTGNNIANASTTGFKASEVQFGSLLSQVISAGAAPGNGLPGGSNPQAVGLGVNVTAENQEMGQGTLEETGVPTDLALQGNGFFVLSTGQAQYLTRAGDMTLDSNGNIIEGNTGWQVQGWSTLTPPAAGATSKAYTLGAWTPGTTNATTAATGNLTIPQQIQGNAQGLTAGQTYSLQSYSINPDGTVTGVYSYTNPTTNVSTSATVTLGQIALANVPNPGGLVPEGNTAYAVGPDTGAMTLGNPGANGVATITSGALEMSNVNLANEMSGLVTIQAGYQADTKVITTDQQLIQALLTAVQ